MKPGSRYEAQHYGYKWYRATKPCDYGHLSLRRTSDCACKECLEWAQDNKKKRKKKRKASDPKDEKIRRRQKRHADRLLARLPVDQRAMVQADAETVISRSAARALRWDVFRTGKPCGRGHSSWRFMAGGGCIVCGSFD
jgi:hypothetical protein